MRRPSTIQRKQELPDPLNRYRSHVFLTLSCGCTWPRLSVETWSARLWQEGIEYACPLHP